MPIDTLFGNRMEIEVTAELTNTHDPSDNKEVTNRLLLADMIRVMVYSIAEVAAEDERQRVAARENAVDGSGSPVLGTPL